MTNLFKFLKDNFKRMPKWLQVLTYVVILCLFVYLTLLPKYIDGKLVAKLDETVGYFPVRNAVIEVDVHGRTILLLTDARGKFSIPFPSKVPFDSYNFMFFPNYFDSDPGSSQRGCPVEIPLKISFTEALSKRVQILYDEKNRSYRLETSMRIAPGVVSAAYAETGSGQKRKVESDADFKKEVISSLAFVTKMPEQKVSLDASLREDLKLSAVQLSYVYARLSKIFDIDGYGRAWNSAKKVRDLVNLSSEHYKLIGIDYYKAGQYDKAVEFYEKSLGQNLQDERTYNYKGYSLYKSKKYKEALEALQTSNKINPAYFMARLNLAKVYCATGNTDKAEHILLGNPELSEADLRRAQGDSEFESVCKEIYLKIKR